MKRTPRFIQKLSGWAEDNALLVAIGLVALAIIFYIFVMHGGLPTPGARPPTPTLKPVVTPSPTPSNTSNITPTPANASTPTPVPTPPPAGTPLVQFSKSAYNASSVDGVVTVTLVRSNVLVNETIQVAVNTSDGTAHSGPDYASVNQIVQFAFNEMSKDFVVLYNVNSTNKTFFVNIVAVNGNATTGSIARASITVTSYNPAPTPTPTPAPTQVPTWTPTPPPGPTPVPTPTPAPTPTPTPSPTPSPTPVPTPPTASFICNPTSATVTGASGTNPIAVVVQLTDTSSGTITSWDWNFGDGATFHSNVGGSTSHTYSVTAAADYTISLTVSGPAGTNAHTYVFHVNNNPPPPPPPT